MRKHWQGWVVAAFGIGVMPLTAQASEIQATFDWVNGDYAGSYTPATVVPSGSITLDLNLASVPAVGGASFTTSTYSSDAAWEAAIAAFSFTASNGQTYTLQNITSITAPDQMTSQPGALVWNDSNDVTPQFSSSMGNYLVPSFILANSTETLSFNTGASTLTTVGLSTNSVASTSVYDVGYWELASATPLAPVPLPAGLPLLLGGLCLVGWCARPRQRAALDSAAQAV